MKKNYYMVFNKIMRSLDEVLRRYTIRYEEKPFVLATDFTMPEAVRQDLSFVIEKLDYKSTEVICLKQPPFLLRQPFPMLLR